MYVSTVMTLQLGLTMILVSSAARQSTDRSILQHVETANLWPSPTPTPWNSPSGGIPKLAVFVYMMV